MESMIDAVEPGNVELRDQLVYDKSPLDVSFSNVVHLGIGVQTYLPEISGSSSVLALSSFSAFLSSM